MAEKQSVINGVILGMIAAIAIYYICTTVAALSFVGTLLTYISNAIFGAWPAIASLGVTAMNYVLAAIVGVIIGLVIEYK